MCGLQDYSRLAKGSDPFDALKRYEQLAKWNFDGHIYNESYGAAAFWHAYQDGWQVMKLIIHPDSPIKGI